MILPLHALVTFIGRFDDTVSASAKRQGGP
jgi:hypothetical protein